MQQSGECDDFITSIGPDDVLLGRGNHVLNRGNEKFRDIVQSRSLEYWSCVDNASKDDIARQIVDAVHSRNGRFLRKVMNQPKENHDTESCDPNCAVSTSATTTMDTQWRIAETESIMVKVKQTLRDMNASLRKRASAAEKIKKPISLSSSNVQPSNFVSNFTSQLSALDSHFSSTVASKLSSLIQPTVNTDLTDVARTSTSHSQRNEAMFANARQAQLKYLLEVTKQQNTRQNAEDEQLQSLFEQQRAKLMEQLHPTSSTTSKSSGGDDKKQRGVTINPVSQRGTADCDQSIASHPQLPSSSCFSSSLSDPLQQMILDHQYSAMNQPRSQEKSLGIYSTVFPSQLNPAVAAFHHNQLNVDPLSQLRNILQHHQQQEQQLRLLQQYHQQLSMQQQMMTFQSGLVHPYNSSQLLLPNPISQSHQHTMSSYPTPSQIVPCNSDHNDIAATLSNQLQHYTNNMNHPCTSVAGIARTQLTDPTWSSLLSMEPSMTSTIMLQQPQGTYPSTFIAPTESGTNPMIMYGYSGVFDRSSTLVPSNPSNTTTALSQEPQAWGTTTDTGAEVEKWNDVVP